MTANEQYIKLNLDADIRSLALKKVPDGIDALWCLRQIEGYQTAKKKLPQWAATAGLWYPPRLSLEQCSSEATALYKRSIVLRLFENVIPNKLVDLTGGFGVDFSYLAQGVKDAVYVEEQEELCHIATHNMPLLGLRKAIIENADGTTYLNNLDYADIIYIDPARRDNVGRKTVSIADCMPDISTLQNVLLAKSRYTLIKLSPMLDITQALRTLSHVCEIHVVCVKGECKELLFITSTTKITHSPTLYTVNLNTSDAPFTCIWKDYAPPKILPDNVSVIGLTLCEPHAGIQKAGVQDAFANKYGLYKLHPMSNLFVGNISPKDSFSIPARVFRITKVSDFSKSSLKEMFNNTRQGNLTVRNFPSTVASLRKRLHLKDGGDNYFFATTLSDNSHVIIKCEPYR